MKTKLIALTVALAAAFSAQASLITPGVVASIGASESSEISAVQSLLYPGEDVNEFVFISKFQDGGSLDNTASNAHDGSAFNITPVGGWATTDVLVGWDFTGLGFEVWGVVLKAGTTARLYAVEESMRVVLDPQELAVTANHPSNPAISHISFIGKRGGEVPDSSSTFAFAGIGLVLVCLGGWRRGLRAV